MLTFKPCWVGIAAVVPLALGAIAAQATELELGMSNRAAQLLPAAPLSYEAVLPSSVPELQRGERPWTDTAALLKQNELLVIGRCVYRPLLGTQVESLCEPVVLPANIGGGPEFDLIPERPPTNIQALPTNVDLDSVPLNSASDDPDPQGLGVQVRF